MSLSRNAAVLALVLGFPSAVFAEGQLPWGENFEKPELRAGTLWCDAHQTAFTTYLGPRSSTGRGTEFTGITIAIKGKTKIYIYSPNSNSMSPLASSFSLADDGSYAEISMEERDQLLRKEAPNLYAAFLNKKNDCVNVRVKKP
jgi:hypothetical protein